MQDGTYPTRGFATLGPLELQPPFATTYSVLKTPPFRVIALGRRQTKYWVYSTSLSLVFLLNSRFVQFYVTI